MDRIVLRQRAVVVLRIFATTHIASLNAFLKSMASSTLDHECVRRIEWIYSDQAGYLDTKESRETSEPTNPLNKAPGIVPEVKSKTGSSIFK